MQHVEQKFSGAGNMELYRQSWRPDGAARAAILLIHGFGEHGGRYNYLIDHLVPKGYVVHNFDLRGHGRSPGPRGHVDAWDELRDDVRAFVATTVAANAGQPPEIPYFLFGHSLGGLIALNYALQYPEGLRGVIASAPLLAQANLSPMLRLAALVLLRVKPDFPIKTALDDRTISRDPAEVQRYRQDPLNHAIGTPRLDQAIRTAIVWTQMHAADLRLPLLLYHGVADLLVPIRGSRTFFDAVSIADKTWIEYAGGFHESHNDLDRAMVFDDLTRWLEAHLPTTA